MLAPAGFFARARRASEFVLDGWIVENDGRAAAPLALEKLIPNITVTNRIVADGFAVLALMHPCHQSYRQGWNYGIAHVGPPVDRLNRHRVAVRIPCPTVNSSACPDSRRRRII